MHRPPRTLIRRLAGGALAGTLGIALVGGIAPAAHATALPDPLTITLTPATATLPTGTHHTVVAKVALTSNGAPAPNVTLHYVITSPDRTPSTLGGNGTSGADGTFSVDMDATVAGTDTLTVCTDDGQPGCTTSPVKATATVTWTQNQAPTADDQVVVTGQRRPTPLTLTASDPDGQIAFFGLPFRSAHGSLAVISDVLVYTPDAGFIGTDSFDFTASDGTLDSAPATVTIIVRHDATLQVRQEHRPRITVNSLLKTLVPDPTSNRPRKIVVLSDDGQKLIQLVLNRTESGDRGDSRRTRYVGTLSFVRGGKLVKLPVKATWNPVTKTVSGEWDKGRDEGRFTLVIDPAPAPMPASMPARAARAS